MTASRIDRALLALAAPSWQRRYRDEFAELQAETRSSLAERAGVIKLAAKSWLRPAKHLHTPLERVQATITTFLTLTMVLFAASTTYWFMSIDRIVGEQAKTVSWAHATRLFTVVTALVLAATFAVVTAVLVTSRRVSLGAVVRPMAAAAAGLVAVGAATMASTPGLSRLDLGPASWFVVPVGVVATAALPIGLVAHRLLAAARPRPLLLAVAMMMSWSAMAFMVVATFDDFVIRGEGRHAGIAATFSLLSYFLRSWKGWLLLLLVTILALSTVSLGRAARAVVRRSPTREGVAG